MKRELLQNVKVQPYTSGDILDRSGFLSAVIGASVAAEGDLTVTAEHSDDGTTFVPVTDKLIYPEKATKDGVYTATGLVAGDIVNVDVDLVGLKRYVKFTAAGATLAVALGDTAEQPV